MWLFKKSSATPPDTAHRNRKAAAVIALGLAILGAAAAVDLRGYNVLVAHNLDHAVFGKTVILTTRSITGSFGLILNRPLTAEQQAQLPELLKTESVAYGGPVEFPEKITALLWKPASGQPPSLDYKFKPLNPATPLNAAELRQTLQALQAEGYQYRLFAGYAGWQPLQLEVEIFSDAWTVLKPSAIPPPLSHLLDGSAADWTALHAK